MYSSYGGGRVGGVGMAGAGGGFGGMATGANGGFVAGARGANGGACGMGAGEECTACGVGCGGAGNGALSYVGSGQGEYVQETTYKYVGHGGDFDVARPRRDFTCIVTSCCLLSLLLLIPLLSWLMSGSPPDQPGMCDDAGSAMMWSQAQREYCCMTVGTGCSTTALPIIPATMPATPFPTPPPTQPPTQPATPGGPVDPFNCAVDPENTWKADKKAWCCRIHHRGCPQTAPPPPPPQPILPPVQPILPPVQPTMPPRPADPYNCNDGFANWQAGWSVPKKEWCCRVHGKGCPNQGGGCATSSEPYDCNAGFANWQAGWSVAKKAWCCSNKGKGCPPAAGGCA